MAKREFIDKKAFIDRSAIEFVSLKDSLRYMEWSKNNEVQLEMIATTITEQEIVKPYLEKLKTEIEKKHTKAKQTSSVLQINAYTDCLQMIDNLLSESEG